MTLATYDVSSAVYLARGAEVNPNRPVFIGDVFRDAPIPGVQADGMVVVVAHPCSFRLGADLAGQLLVAAVTDAPKQGRGMWKRGLYDRAPLPDLDGDGLWVAHLDLLGRATTADLLATQRVAVRRACRRQAAALACG